MKPTLEAMERPIIMTGESVRAILDDRKTQTRVPIGLGTLKPSETPGYDWTFRGRAPIRSIAGQRRHQHGCWQDLSIDELLALCPHGAVGDRLWVKETWQTTTTPDGRDVSKLEYAADWGGEKPGFCEDEWSWRSPLFMPRWVSRITLEITNVRVQRVQDISEEDARAEGAPLRMSRAARGAFAAAWDGVNSKRAPWAANPWVWALTFRRVP